MFDLLCIDSLKPLGCWQALGMESGAITDNQIQASSQWDSSHAPFQGRLHFQGSFFKAGSWSAGRNDLLQWLQIDLGSQYTKVTRVATQGRNAHSQWVTRYKLMYSNDGLNFQYYWDQGKPADEVQSNLLRDQVTKQEVQSHKLNVE